MDFFRMNSDVVSLDDLGVAYEEPQQPSTRHRNRNRRRRQRLAGEGEAAAASAFSPPSPSAGSGEGVRSGSHVDPVATSSGTFNAREGPLAGSGGWDDTTETATTDYNTYSSSLPYPTTSGTDNAGRGTAVGMSSAGNSAGTDNFRRTTAQGGRTHAHARENSLGFTFSGQPMDVVRFRSCIPPTLSRSRHGGEVAPAPEQNGPFSADIFNVVLLFVDAADMQSILEVCRVCRFWRYYANFAPHWSYFRRKNWIKKEDRLAKYIRAIVAKPKIMSREEYFTEKRRVEVYERRDRIIGRVKHVRWCVAVAIMAAAMTTANFVVAYTLGFLRTALRSDAKLGATTAVLMTVMTLLEVTVVLIPLGGVSSPSNKDGMIRILSWGLVILDISLVLGTITALAFTRVQANGHVLDGPTMNFSMGAECTVYPSNNYPSFALLPALLWDLRWRPITTDPTGSTLVPYCLSQPNDKSNETQQCYVVMYFDANYTSDVFHSEEALQRSKDAGTTTAFGVDPFEGTGPIRGTWCTASEYPQMVALTTAVYGVVAAERNTQFPTSPFWLNPALRPDTFGVISYRCSSDINRETTEDPRGSTDMWMSYSPAWRRYYVPLLAYERQVRSTFQSSHDHFLHYAFRCYIIAAVIWGLQLLAQCIVKNAPVDILGVTAAATLVLFNPLSVLISGVLCVFVSSRDFMCSDSAGFGLIGAGLALFMTMTTVFVIVYD